MKKLIIFSFVFFVSSLMLVSQNEVNRPTKFIFERSDGSVYEKMQGAENLVEIKSGRENNLISSRLTENHHKIVVNRVNGESVYSFNFKDWYKSKDDSQIENSHNLNELTNFSISPNPTNGNTKVTFNIEEDSYININIYTLNGVKISNLLEKKSLKGLFSHEFDINRYSSGVYIYQVVINNLVYTYQIIKN